MFGVLANEISSVRTVDTQVTVARTFARWTHVGTKTHDNFLTRVMTCSLCPHVDIQNFGDDFDVTLFSMPHLRKVSDSKIS